MTAAPRSRTSIPAPSPPQGNRKAQDLVAELFELRDAFEWRGLGVLPASALKLRPAYARFDAEARFAVATIAAADNPACECGAILRGLKRPPDCRLFGTRLHAGDADRRLHGVVGGRLRRALDLWPLPRAGARGANRGVPA